MNDASTSLTCCFRRSFLLQPKPHRPANHGGQQPHNKMKGQGRAISAKKLADVLQCQVGNLTLASRILFWQWCYMHAASGSSCRTACRGGRSGAEASARSRHEQDQRRFQNYPMWCSASCLLHPRARATLGFRSTDAHLNSVAGALSDLLKTSLDSKT